VKKARPRKARPSTAKPTPVDAYLAGLGGEQRAALERLREVIRASGPGAEECISYGVPAFRQDGFLVGFAAARTHCAFYPGNGATVAAVGRALAGYHTSPGTIRFQPDRPLPAALVRTVVKARLAENAARRGGAARNSGTVARRARPAAPARPRHRA